MESEAIYRPPVPGPPRHSYSAASLWLFVALAVGAVVRLIWLGAVDTQPVTDFDWYYQRAVEMAAGHGYQVNGAATAYWPVGYPAFLALFFSLVGDSVVLGKALNFILTLAVIPLSFRLAQRLFRNQTVAIATAMILAVHPSFVAYSGILASEPLFTVLTLLGTLILLNARDRRKNWLWGGIVFGLAVLVRPQAALIPAIVLVAAWRWDDFPTRSFPLGRAMAWTYLALILAISPWLIRNAAVFNSFVFISTNGGDNILIGNHEGATGRYKNPDACGLVRPTGLSEIERERLARQAGLGYVKAHPLRTLRLWPAKLEYTFVTSSDVAYWAFQTEKGTLIEPGRGDDKRLYIATKDSGAMVTQMVLGMSLAGMVFLPLLRRRLSGVLTAPATAWMLIAYTGLLSVAFFGNPRFAFPVLPFLIMYAVSLPVALTHLLAKLPAIPDEAAEDEPTESQSL